MRFSGDPCQEGSREWGAHPMGVAKPGSPANSLFKGRQSKQLLFIVPPVGQETVAFREACAPEFDPLFNDFNPNKEGWRNLNEEVALNEYLLQSESDSWDHDLDQDTQLPSVSPAEATSALWQPSRQDLSWTRSPCASFGNWKCTAGRNSKMHLPLGPGQLISSLSLQTCGMTLLAHLLGMVPLRLFGDGPLWPAANAQLLGLSLHVLGLRAIDPQQTVTHLFAD